MEDNIKRLISGEIFYFNDYFESEYEKILGIKPGSGFMYELTYDYYRSSLIVHSINRGKRIGIVKEFILYIKENYLIDNKGNHININHFNFYGRGITKFIIEDQYGNMLENMSNAINNFLVCKNTLNRLPMVGDVIAEDGLHINLKKYEIKNIEFFRDDYDECVIIVSPLIKEPEDPAGQVTEIIGKKPKFKTGEKIIWDSGFGYDIGYYVGEKEDGINVDLFSGHQGECTFYESEIFPYSKILVKKLTKKYGYQKMFSEKF